MELDPENVLAHNNLGLTRANLGDFEKSIPDLSRAIELDPTYAFAYRNRGKSYAKLNQLDKACIDFNTAIELGDDFAKELKKEFCTDK